jgi:hypothetical protein
MCAINSMQIKNHDQSWQIMKNLRAINSMQIKNHDKS